jgi:hypothetical protein
MNEQRAFEHQDKELPRWVQVPAGLILGLLTLLCGFASVSLLSVPNKKAPILATVVGLTLLLGCFWVLEKVFSFDNRSQEPRRFDESDHTASSVFLLAGASDCGLIHWLLSRNGCPSHISSSDIRLRVSGASRISSETAA